MESNLDDIKDNALQEGDPKKTKRLLLIGVASAVLLTVLIVVITFLTKKESPKNPEFNVGELEKIANIAGDNTKAENPKDEEFDRLIQELKSKQPPEEVAEITQSASVAPTDTQAKEPMAQPNEVKKPQEPKKIESKKVEEKKTEAKKG